MTRILVTGSKGQLGSEIQEMASEFMKISFDFTDVEELDIASYDTLFTYIKNGNFDYIINCAAYTAVDKAESESELAYSINQQAVKNLAHISEKLGVKLIHISTDYVFDGKYYKPYKEDHQTNPSSVYGRSKLAGENDIVESKAKAIIIRTSWLYSKYGKNFAKTMVQLGAERSELNVVFDQVGSPTNAEDLAHAILTIIQSGKTEIFHTREIYHFSNEGACSWYDFAKKIMELRNYTCQIQPIESKDYPAPAPRPHYSLFNKGKIKDHFNLSILHWEDSLTKMLLRLD